MSQIEISFKSAIFYGSIKMTAPVEATPCGSKFIFIKCSQFDLS